jgi:hypothetical protein
MRLAIVVSIALAGCGQGLPPPATADQPLACSAAAYREGFPVENGGPPASAWSLQLPKPPGTWLPVTPFHTTPIDALGPVVIYLNREGALLRGNYDDASMNNSSVVAASGKMLVNYPAASFDDGTWNNIVSCVTDEFSRFDVTITDQRPAGTGYFMAMFGGNGSDINQQGWGGIAPLDAQGCTIIEGAVVFIFSEVWGNVVNGNCETAAQEISHAFSLDHEFLASDPMTYLQFNGHKTFQDQDAMCGEYMARPCICGRPSQNSVAVLTDKIGLLGKPADHNPPTVMITSPSDGAEVTEGKLQVVVHAEDDGTVAKVTLYMQDSATMLETECGDGKAPCKIVGSDYTFSVPGGKGYGNVYAVAIDGGNNSTTSNLIHVKFDPAPTTGTITVDVDPASATVTPARTATVKAKITTTLGMINAANLAWTDASGMTMSYPMCPLGGSEWSLPMQIGSAAGARSFSVSAGDTVGDKAASQPVMLTP